jgi:rubrerythrin
MSTRLDLSKISLKDALDLATLTEIEAHKRYKMFASQLGFTGGYDAGAFFNKMADYEAKHRRLLEDRRKALFGDAPARVTLGDLFDVEAPGMGAPRRGMSTVQAFEIGLAAEKKAHDFYDMALPGITDPEVRALFTELRDQETKHFEILQEEMAKLPPSASIEHEYDLDESPYL